MTEIASAGQLRMSLLRWTLVTVPGTVLLGFLAGRLVPAGSDNRWYQLLDKPALTPPGWVFPVAWTTLYVMLGLALAMVANARGARGRGLAITLFVVQLLMNYAWTPLFFGAHQVVPAFWLIVAILSLSVVVTALFARIRRAAAWLLVPYMVWLGYAGMLTLGIDRLNPDAATLVPGRATTKITL